STAIRCPIRVPFRGISPRIHAAQIYPVVVLSLLADLNTEQVGLTFGDQSRSLRPATRHGHNGPNTSYNLDWPQGSRRCCNLGSPAVALGRSRFHAYLRKLLRYK